MAFAGDVNYNSVKAVTVTLSGEMEIIGGGLIKGLGLPMQPNDAANKQYVDTAAQGLDVKNSVRLATTEDLGATYDSEAQTLTAEGNGALIIDGVAVQVGNRILVKDMFLQNRNGIYTVSVSGGLSESFVLTRSVDANSEELFTPGLFTFVEQGTFNGGKGFIFVATADPFVFGSDAIAFTQFSGPALYTAGNGLDLLNGQFSAVGTSNRIAVSSSGIDISTNYIGQSSITTVGALSSGSIVSGFSSIDAVPIGTTTPDLGNFTDIEASGTLNVDGKSTFNDVDVNGTMTIGSGGSITGLPTPNNSSDAVPKIYVDDAIASAYTAVQNLDSKNSCFVATTENLSSTYFGGVMTATSNGALVIDGETDLLGKRILVKDQFSAQHNGMYLVDNGGDSETPWNMVRTLDADSSEELSPGTNVFVEAGFSNKGKLFVFIQSSPETFNLGTSNVRFIPHGLYTAGSGIQVESTTGEISVVGTADRIDVSVSGVDISENYIGQSSISTVGTLTSGSISTGFTGIDNVPIGESLPSTGKFSTLNAFSDFSVEGTSTMQDIIVGGSLEVDGQSTFNNHITMANTKTIKNVPLPVESTDVANKQYVDATAQGLDVKNSCYVATTLNLVATYNSGTKQLVANSNGQLVVDGVSFTVAGFRVLVKNQTNSQNNGIYVIMDTGAVGRPWILERTQDANDSSKVTPGMFTFIEAGTVNAASGFVFIDASPSSEFVFESDPITFTKFSTQGAFTAGVGIELNGGEISAVGTANRIDVSGSGIDISANYIGQSSITTVGELSSGSINGMSGIDDTPIGATVPSTGNFSVMAAHVFALFSYDFSSNETLPDFSKTFITGTPSASTTITLTIPSGAVSKTILWITNMATANDAKISIDFGAANLAGPGTSTISPFRYATLGPAMSTQFVYNGSKWIFLNTGVQTS